MPPNRDHKSARPATPSVSPDAFTFEVGSDEYAILVFPIQAVEAPQGLSPAETAIAMAVFAGKSNASIAADRRTSLNTVANQLRSIYQKLGVSGRRELIRSFTHPRPLS